jgi:predicted alpha/beta superfamily hydrolase
VKRLRTLSATLVLTLAAPLLADEERLIPRDRPQLAVENWSFNAKTTGRKYDISVGLPATYDADAEKKWPAVVVLDGNRVFGMALDIARGLIQSQEVNDLFVISIGTPFEEGFEAWPRRRVHEFSPDNDWPLTDAFGQLLKRLCEGRHQLSTDACLGGAPLFLQFIRDELLPLLKTRYRMDPDDLCLFGISAGGFFASWTLLQESSPFQSYIISSPAMAYGDGEILRLESRWAESHDDLKARVYMAAGMLETDTAFEEAVGKIVSGMAQFAGALATRNYPGLRIQTEMHPGLGHSDAAAATFAIGLRKLYGQKTVRPALQ